MSFEDHDQITDLDAVVEEAVAGLPALVPIKLACECLGISACTLRRWANRGRLRVLKTVPGTSGRVLVPKAELGRLIRLMGS